MALGLPTFRVAPAQTRQVPSYVADTPVAFAALAETAAAGGRALEQYRNRRAQERGERAAIEAVEQGRLELIGRATTYSRSHDATMKRLALAEQEGVFRREAARIQREFQGRPGEMAQAFDQYQESQTADLARQGLVDLVPDARVMLASLKSGAVTDADGQAFAQAREDQAAALSQRVRDRQIDIERIAARLDIDPNAPAQLAQAMASLEQVLLDHGPQGAFGYGGAEYDEDAERAGTLGTDEMAAIMGEMDGAVRTNRVLGTFRNLPDTGERERFLRVFEADYYNPETGEFQDNPTAGFTRQEVDTLAAKMRQQIRAESVGRARQASIADDVDRNLGQMILPDDATMAALRAEAVLQPQGRAAAVMRRVSLAEALRGQAPADLERVAAGMRAQVADGASLEQADQIGLVERLAETARVEAGQDPLRYAAKAGLGEAPPLDFLTDEKGLTFAARARHARAVASELGTAPRMLTRGEAAALEVAIDGADLDTRVALAGRLVEGFGPDAAPMVFQEIADKRPIFARSGALMAAGAPEAARDALAGEIALKEGIVSLPKFDAQGVEDEVLGQALGAASQTRGDAVKTARAIYAARIDPTATTRDDFDTDLYRQALNEAMGARYIQGVRYGGVTDFNGREVIAPNTVRADQFEEKTQSVLLTLKTRDLSAALVGGGDVRHADGSKVRPAEIADLFLVSSGEGRYRISYTDPALGAPQYLVGNGPGGLAELDFAALLRRNVSDPDTLPPSSSATDLDDARAFLGEVSR